MPVSQDVLAKILPGQTTELGWILNSVGNVSTFAALAVGVGLFAGACLLVNRRKAPAVLASYLTLLPLPALISLCGTMKGMIASFTVIAASETVQPTMADFAGGLAASLLSLLLAILISFPTYLLLTINLLVRTARSEPQPPAGA